MARVTAIEVMAIMPDVVILESTVDLYLATGTLLIDSVFGAADVSDLTTLIEKWFVAHIIASTQQGLILEEKVGDASIKYHEYKGEGLNSTPYGRMVLLLDRLGLMSNLAKRRATMYAVKSFDE